MNINIPSKRRTYIYIYIHFNEDIHFCIIQDIELAKMLMRPSGLFVEEMSKEFLLSEEKYGSVRRVYVVCEGDQVMEEEFQSFLINNSPPQQVKSIKEAGHMVMLSKAQEICVCLQEIAEDYR